MHSPEILAEIRGDGDVERAAVKVMVTVAASDSSDDWEGEKQKDDKGVALSVPALSREAVALADVEADTLMDASEVLENMGVSDCCGEAESESVSEGLRVASIVDDAEGGSDIDTVGAADSEATIETEAEGDPLAELMGVAEPQVDTDSVRALLRDSDPVELDVDVALGLDDADKELFSLRLTRDEREMVASFVTAGDSDGSAVTADERLALPEADCATLRL